MPERAATPDPSALPIRMVQHQSELMHFEMALRRPHPRLRAWVRRYCGYVEHRTDVQRRMEVPGRDTVLIINFGPPLKIIDPRVPLAAPEYGTFVSGLYDSYVLVESPGPWAGIQVDFTPIGAHLFLGVPMVEVTNRVVELSDLFGAAAAELVERLRRTRGWAARFDLLDDLIARRIEVARAPSPEVGWAWDRLQQSAGDVRIAGLARESGWSHRHLISRFRAEIGLPPRVVARILRFSRVIRLLERAPNRSWGEIAQICGYYDQAHFNRDFREFAGTTPGEFVARRLPGGGVSGD